MATRELPGRAPVRLLIGVALIVQLLVIQIGVIAPGATAAADRVINNGEHFPNGFVVPAGQTWVFDPAKSTAITVSGNVEVRGRLEMKPAQRTIHHTMTFTGVDNRKFVGAVDGQVVPVATDVGLWVLGNGVVDIQGTEKTPWSYTYDPAWTGDEVRAAPVAVGNYTSFPTVTSTPAAHSSGYRSELLNLTRNVTIQGTASGRTHVFIRSTQPQTIRFATIRYVSPDLHGGDTRTGTNITGRYGLHFHHSMDGSRSSLIEGVVIRDAANHAYVPHHSHGITFRDTIAYETTAEAYWWDESSAALCGSVPECNVTHDVLYDGIVAAYTHASPYAKHTSSSIQLGAGTGNTVVNSVAVGLQGKGMNNAGFIWPAKDQATWTFQNNVSHNHNGSGAFVWHNGSMPHQINGFEAYHNKKAGVIHGAYNNSYVWRNLTLVGNNTSIDSHALGRAASDGSTDTQHWSNVKTGGKGTLVPLPHNNTGDQSAPVRFTHCDFAKVQFDEIGTNGKTKSTAYAGMYDFVECGLTQSDFNLTGASNDTVIRVQDGTSAYQLTGSGKKTTIATFAAVNPPLPPAPPPRRIPAPGQTGPTTIPPTTAPTTTAPPTTTPTTTLPTSTTWPTTTVVPTTTLPPTTTTVAPTTTVPPTSTTRPRDRDRSTTTTRPPRGGGSGRSETVGMDAAEWDPEVPPEVVYGPYFCGLI